MLDKNHALVILSGGQDSTTCLGIALDKYDKVSCITFDYGQSHSIELDAARTVCQFYRDATKRYIPHNLVDVKGVLLSTSPLTNNGDGLDTYESSAQMEEEVGDRVEKTFVPMRNMLFLVIAANHAVAIGAQHLVTGVCQEDNANYPDCRESFIAATFFAIKESLGLGAEEALGIYTPLMHLSKSKSVLLALATPHAYSALAWSHTAYDGKYPPNGKDHASILRADGFFRAGVPDPLVMRAVADGLMDLPDHANYSNDAIEMVAPHLMKAGI